MPLPGQGAVGKFYNGDVVQVGVACLIGANFLTNIVEKEIDPHGKLYTDTFGGFELFYNICFTIELGVNMYAHWFKSFWKSSWNIFDCVVVTIGLINMAELPLPPSFSMLRMMRAFRVFRLFKRVRSLNKIIVAIIHAVPGVMNAFLILAIVMSIYAILAVEFYFEMGNDCLQATGDSSFVTPRGYCAGHEYWGTFTKAIYTFFQVLTGESWSEAVARPAIWFYHDDPIKAVGGGLFFVSYVLISAFVLTNVVVAVLLDKMVDPEVHDGEEEGEEIHEGEDDGTGTMPDGEVKTAPPIAEDLDQSMAMVTEQIEQLTAFSETMRTNLGGFRSEMTEMREAVARVLVCIPAKAVV